MPRFWWPGYEMKLIGGLQRQQNCVQFCDILLQTEGISVPAHSCILAALCPQLSQKLAAFPVAPSNQCHMLYLQAVKGQTLRNLITLLYFGEVEVKGSIEENDLLSVTQQVGITLLVKGQKKGAKKEGESENKKCRSFEQGAEKSDSEKNKSRKLQDVLVQTETLGERSTGSQTEERCCVSTGTQTVEGLQSPAQPPQNIPLDEQFHLHPLTPNGVPSDGESASDSFHLHPHVPTGTRSTDNTANNNVTDETHSVEQPSHFNRHGKPDKGSPKTKVLKSLVKMKNKTPASMKMRLRKRKRRSSIKETWEVVQKQGADETLSILTYNRDPSKGLSSVVQPNPVHNPESQIHYSSDSHDSQLLCPDNFIRNQSPAQELVPLSQPLGPEEESDEIIEKLLDDVMMGLNILPNMERDLLTSHHPQLCCAGAPASCQVPAAESNWFLGCPQAAVATQHSTYPAQNHLSCSNLSSNAEQHHCAMGHMPGDHHQDMPWFTSQNCSCPEASLTKSILPSGLSSNRRKHPAWQEPSSQDNHNITDFFLPANGSEMQSMNQCSSHRRCCLCGSPLNQFDESARQQQPLTPLGRPRFPQSDITYRNYAPGSQDADWSTRWQKHRQLNSQKNNNKRKKGKHSGSITGHQVPAGKPSNVKRTRKRWSRYKQNDREGEDAVTKKRKRKRTSHFQDVAGHVLALKHVKISEEAKRQISQSVCMVNLSSNNMLAMEREAATCSSGRGMGNTAPTEITHHLKRKTRNSVQPSANHSLIRTQYPETLNNAGPEDSGRRTMTQQSEINNKEVVVPKRKRGRQPRIKPVQGPGDLSEVTHSVRSEHQVYINLPPKNVKRRRVCRNNKEVVVPKRKRGRPPKIKPVQSPGDLSEVAHSVRSEHQVYINLPPKNVKRQRVCRKKRRRRSDVIHPKTRVAENMGKVDKVGVMNEPKTPKQLLEKLVDLQHPEAENSQETPGNETATGCEMTFDSEPPVTNPNEDTTQQAAPNDEDLSHGDTHTPLQGDRNPIHNSMKPRRQEITNPPLSCGAGSIKSSGCSQVEQEEEVDIMCYSPDIRAQSRESVVFLDSIDIEEEGEEEEEDDMDIDVTGD